MIRSSALLTSAGFSSFASQEITHSLAKAFFPRAEAQEAQIKRVIEVTWRSGVPFMALGTGREFTQLSGARFVNAPTAPSAFLNNGNSLYLNSYARALLPYANNIAISQGAAVEGGHTAMFANRVGGIGGGQTSPVIATSNANSSKSVVHGLVWGRQSLATNQTNGLDNLIAVSASTIFDLFKRPYFPVNDNELKAIVEASQKLSRRQALLLQNAMKTSVNVANSQHKASSLLTEDATNLLNINAMPGALTGTSGGNIYRDFGRAMAYTLRAMASNLTNSAQIVVATGDWHGSQTIGNAKVRTFGTECANRLAAAIAFLQNTPEPGDNSKTLWDTTAIVMTTEFTRGISGVGKDNPDGRTQGFVMIGKNVRGGYYGGFNLRDSNGTTGAQNEAYGFDRITGAPTPGAKNSNVQIYNTIQYLLGNSYDSSRVMQAVVA